MEKFKNFLSTNRHIHNVKTKKKTVRDRIKIEARSNSICEDLYKYDIFPQKIGKIEVPSEFKYDKNYWRGLIDSDGCLHDGKNVFQLTLANTSHNLLEGFKNFVKIYTNTNATIYKKQDYFRVGSLKAKKMAKVLYQDAEVYLDRKYNIVKQFFDK